MLAVLASVPLAPFLSKVEMVSLAAASKGWLIMCMTIDTAMTQRLN